MDAPSVLVAPGQGALQDSAVCRKRRYYRHLVSPLAYVRVDHANGGIIRDLNESGLGVQAVAPLHADQVVHLRFDLLRPRVRIETTGQVMWADRSGQAGIRFLDLPPAARRDLKEWLFVTLLTAASEHSVSRAPIFKNREDEDEFDGLIVSAPPMPAIRLAPADVPVRSITAQLTLIDEPEETAEMPVRLPWWPGDISPTFLARFVDGLIIVSAVLLFSIVFVATTGTFPSWAAAFAITLGSAVMFSYIYRYMFTTFSQTTLGWRLAKLAAEDLHWVRKVEEDTPRFR
jgi:PilZ domain